MPAIPLPFSRVLCAQCCVVLGLSVASIVLLQCHLRLRFQIPKQVPYVYGMFCEQSAWQDVSTPTKVTPPYDGSWRYDNETWVIVRDISTCPCFPRSEIMRLDFVWVSVAVDLGNVCD